ncbi:glycosyltransferase family 4 protein [Petroclostridium xylanilyticum]|uniref:glycosyltransferase family 4 protein n=1 Tax=Petroclostridium xylanilyticum TaxID=1792311 RepID=UPI000B98C5D6|nr:glycosyltransferase family 4 protein [Petroclostridium xylanilyticum]
MNEKMQAELSNGAKILYLINSLGLGGAENLLVTTLKHLDRKRFQVDVCCLRRSEPLKQEIENMNIKIYDFKAPPFKISDIKIMVYCIKKLRKLVKEEKYDIVHTHLYESSIIARFATFGLKTRIVTTIHSTDPWLESTALKDKIKKYIEYFSLKVKPTVNIAISKAVKHYYLKNFEFLKKDIRLVYNFIDYDKFKYAHKAKLNIDSAKKVVLTIARFYEEKGHIYLIKAFYKLITEYKVDDYILLLVGGGPLLEQVRDLCSELCISEKVVFLEERKDIPNILHYSDVFVLPSLYEGFGIAIVEAMAANKPVIATTVGGVPEIIEDGVNGLLVPPGNVEALTQSMLKLIRNQQLKQKLIENAAIKVKDMFSAEINVKKIEKIYMGVLKNEY